MNENTMPTGIRVLHYDGDGPAPIERILDASPVESDPHREGWRIFLASALSVRPNATVDELVEFAISFVSNTDAVIDRRVVEDVALTMMAAAGDGV